MKITSCKTQFHDIFIIAKKKKLIRCQKLKITLMLNQNGKIRSE